MGKQRKWTEEKIIATLKELHSNGENIRPGSLSIHYPGLWAAGKRSFGGSENMYRTAGFNRDDLNIRKQGHWTEERIRRAIQERFSQGKEMSRRSLMRDDKSLLYMAEKKLKGWYNALDLLEIPIDKKRRVWTNNKVREAILARYASGKNMNGVVVEKDDGGLFSAATKRFGSWYNALDSCGIPYVRKRKWTPEKVKEEILARQTAGKGMSQSDVEKEDYGLVRAAYRNFGTWYKALQSVGISYETFKNVHPVVWTQETIIARLNELRSAGEDMRPASLKSKYHGLYRAGLEVFGDTSNMFRVAGFDLSEFPVRRAWSEGEDEFLRSNYGKMKRAEICSVLGRPPSAIIHRAIRLGLSKTSKAPWTDEELMTLSDPNLTIKEKRGRLPDRTLERIRSEILSRGFSSKQELTLIEYSSGDYVRMVGIDGLTEFAERRSRVVASNILGRPLERDEIVHHINMDKRDDRQENLLICSIHDHLVAHGSLNDVVKGLIEMKIIRYDDKYGYSLNPSEFWRYNGHEIVERPPVKLRYSMLRKKGRVVKRNRIIAAEKLGRPLRDDEVVHHIDMDSKNDRPENLTVLRNPDHTHIHKTLDTLVKKLMDSHIVGFNRELNQYFIV